VGVHARARTMAGIDDVTARGCIAIEWRAIADARASSSRSSRTLGKEPPSPNPTWIRYHPSGVCLGARKRRGVSGAGTHVIDVRDDGHVADVVLLVHLATELIDGELRWAGRERTGGQRLGLERRPEASKAEKWCEVTGPGSARPRVTRRATVGFGGKKARMPSRNAPSAWLR
jgi:hypothetical protein